MNRVIIEDLLFSGICLVGGRGGGGGGMEAFIVCWTGHLLTRDPFSCIIIGEKDQDIC